MPWSDLDALTPQNLNSKSGIVFNVVDPAFGAVGDGVVDDTTAIEAAFAAAVAEGDGAAVLFPQGTYIISRTLQPGAEMVLYFHGATLKAAASGGTWTTVVDNVGADTGFVAFFDIAGFAASAAYGRVTMNGNQVANLVGIVKADIQNGASSGTVLWDARTSLNNFERGVYGQSDGVALTAWHFSHLQGRFNGYDLYLVGNSVDDMTFGIVRSQSSTEAADVNKANIFISDASGLVFDSVFMSGKDSTRDGMIIEDESSVRIRHMFCEDNFNDIIRIDDNGYSVTIDNLMLGTSVLTSTDSAVIIVTSGNGGYLNVTMAADARRTDSMNGIVQLAAVANQNRTTIVSQPYSLSLSAGSSLPPYADYSPGTTASTNDLAIAYTPLGFVRYYFNGTTTFHSVKDKLVTTPTLVAGNLNYDIEDNEFIRVLSGRV